MRIRELENEIGCFFDRNPDGTVHQKAFAGQTFDRTVHKGDLTGIEIVNRLAEQIWRRDVRRLEDHRALDLIPAADGSGLAGVLHARHADRRAADGARARDPARDRRRADDVPLSHALRRQVAATAWRWRCAPACRCATWRWCSSIRPDCSPGPARA